jgi:peptidoglycan hydrolase CwlO-like protein
MNVCFTTRSVRIYIKDAPPEWLPAKRIVTHTTRKGDTADGGTIIEELHDKIMKQDGQIERLKNEKAQLQEKISKNYLGDLLRAVNLMQQGLQEKKHKMEQIDSGLRQIQATLAAINNE